MKLSTAAWGFKYHDWIHHRGVPNLAAWGFKYHDNVMSVNQ